MARVERTEIGTEMYAVFEHIYSVQNRAGPLLEYCVCKGTVRGFFTGGYTEVRLLFTGPDGFPKPGYYKLDDIGKKLFYTAAAAALAKSMTEKYERNMGLDRRTGDPYGKAMGETAGGARQWLK